MAKAYVLGILLRIVSGTTEVITIKKNAEFYILAKDTRPLPTSHFRF